MWFKFRKKGIPEEEVPKLLKKYPLVFDGGNLTISDGKHTTGKIRNLHEFMVEQALVFVRHGIDRPKAPTGFTYAPLQYYKFPVWKVEYLELLKKHAHYYGLKILQVEGVWSVARCYLCDSCPRRLECLGEEF